MLWVKLTTLPNFMLPRNAVHDLLDPMTVKQLLNRSERINHHIVINTGEACESVSTSSKKSKRAPFLSFAKSCLWNLSRPGNYHTIGLLLHKFAAPPDRKMPVESWIRQRPMTTPVQCHTPASWTWGLSQSAWDACVAKGNNNSKFTEEKQTLKADNLVPSTHIVFHNPFRCQSDHTWGDSDTAPQDAVGILSIGRINWTKKARVSSATSLASRSNFSRFSFTATTSPRSRSLHKLLEILNNCFREFCCHLDSGPWTTDPGPDSGLWTVDRGPWTGCEPNSANFRIQHAARSCTAWHVGNSNSMVKSWLEIKNDSNIEAPTYHKVAPLHWQQPSTCSRAIQQGFKNWRHMSRWKANPRKHLNQEKQWDSAWSRRRSCKGTAAASNLGNGTFNMMGKKRDKHCQNIQQTDWGLHL